MVTTLRPHSGVKCPEMPVTLAEQGYLISIEQCENCPNKLEIRRPWLGFIVKCKLDGVSDSRTVEYG